MKSTNPTAQRRNKCFDDTHNELIETAVRLISEKGLDALSIAELSRALGINRTTVYYHFENRDQLIDEVKAWSAMQFAKAFKKDRSHQERIDHITRFVLENPQLIKLWIDDFIAGGDIRDSYPMWDELVAGMKENFAAIGAPDVDVEVFCINLLTSAFIGPRVFKASVCPSADNETVVERFRGESMRMLKELSLLD
jgi:AcrR family transcriptional regulator